MTLCTPLMVWDRRQAETAGKTAQVLLQRSATPAGAGRHSGQLALAHLLLYWPLYCLNFTQMIISTQLNAVSFQQKQILPCRIEGLFKEAMTAALQLPLHDDCTTALAFAAMLLSFASGDVANRALLATTEAVQLAGQLIQVQALRIVLLCRCRPYSCVTLCLVCAKHSLGD